jgi:hypothetical protein
MDPVHACQLCKEVIPIIQGNANLSALVHLSEVHGIVVPEPPQARFYSPKDKVESDRLTEYLEKIKGTKINN